MLGFALNHMTVPGLRYDAVLRMAQSLGCVGVEFRNDLGGILFDGDAPSVVAATARECGQRILALAEVKSFNDWSDAKQAEAARLIDIAADCGAEGVALIPRNDGQACGNGERQANLRIALRALAPMLEARGLVGLVEPLGFDICSLRHKSEAVKAITDLGLTDRFRLVHDTFHHHLAGGGDLFPEMTGIVHISGVTDPELAPEQMQDAHRVHVDVQDRLDNLGQIRALQKAGYTGAISVECFAPAVHQATDPAAELAASFAFIRSNVAFERA